MRPYIGFALLAIGIFPSATTQMFAQSAPSSHLTQNASVVPDFVKFSGTVKDATGAPMSGIVGITFALYQQQTGGVALWMDTQNVAADKFGHYTVSLGSEKALPVELFSSGEARWLSVQVSGQDEQPRVLLVSVPYALKAQDAETVGGLPPSAFILAAPSALAVNDTAGKQTSTVAPATVGGSGTTNFLPIWTGATTLGNSLLFQSGSGATGKIGVGTTTPGATLDVKGTANIQGMLTLPATGAATATGGRTSQPHSFVASSFNSGTKAAVNQTFLWKAEAAGNNTTTPSGTLNLLFGSGAAAPAETGLKLSSKGVFTFATGQTFPGAGTITGVTAGTDLTGGGTSGKITLSLNTASTDARYAQLGAPNTYNQSQQINAATTGLTANISNPSGVGVLASVPNGSGNGVAVQGLNAASKGIGVMGSGWVGVSGASSTGIGVQGTTSGGTAVFGTDAAAGIGVEGVSTNGSGVYGFSSTLNGVYGNTVHGTGVQGISGGDILNTAGVFGRAGNGTLFGGIAGVWGDADQHVGVFGSSNGFAGVIGESQNGYGVQAISSGADGVNATSHTINGSGVAGINDSPQGGIGVYGHSSNGGYGFYTDSNAAQSRSTGGWVKAMAYIIEDPGTSTYTIARCYNSQVTGAAASTPPCGFTLFHVFPGSTIVDFGFQVNDRFVNVLADSGLGGIIAATDFGGTSASQVGVRTWVSSSDPVSGRTDTNMFIFVF
jgi:hypothetical protein